MSESSPGAAIAVTDLVKRFGAVTAVAGVWFEVPRGSIFGLLGRNGAGKTTTLECCVGLQRPTSGSIRVAGLDPTRASDLAKLRRRFGVQLQTTSLPEKATAGEILELYASFYGLRANLEATAQRVGLTGALKRYVGAMSGGEKQRLALALALQHDPEVIFLDEPTAGMDAFGRRILWSEVEQLRAAGKTVVLTTHYIEEAERLCDEICVVQAGRIVARDTPAALVAKFGGAASITFRARGFVLDHSLADAGTWAESDGGFTLATAQEPGAVLARIVTQANANGVLIEALDLHRPGLEDAFLAITGERIEESAAQGAA